MRKARSTATGRERPYRRAPAGIQPDEIITAALALIDRDGLDALSMRRLSSELDVSAPALYWHFADRDAVLDGVAERVLHEDGPIGPFDGDGRVQIKAALMEMRRRLLRHPRAVPIFSAPPRLRAVGAPIVAQVTESLITAGVTGRALVDGVQTLFMHTLGSAFVQACVSEALGLPWSAEQLSSAIDRYLKPDHPAGLPFITAMRDHLHGFSFTTVFARATDALLDDIMTRREGGGA